MNAMQVHSAEQSKPNAVTAPRDTDLLSPIDFEREYGTPETTQAVWRCTNRYGFRQLVFKVGTNVRYRRADVEKWLESRRATVLDGEAA
jgi:hypothetical protein